MSNNDATLITPEKAKEIIEKRILFGKFMAFDGDKVIGIDNRAGQAWKEEFHTIRACARWLFNNPT